MMGRSGRAGAALLLVATTVVGVGPVAGPMGGAPVAEALSFVNILFDRPGETARFGPNELVEIMAGNINYIGGKTRVFGSSEMLPACTINVAGTGQREHPGIDDKLQPFADIYIVPSGQEPTNGVKIVDVNGAPNSVFGGGGGTFLYEPLGITFPEGKISAGVYGLVIDECQNGYYDSGEDSYVDDAFWVDLDQDVPPLSPAASQFKALKQTAKTVDSAMGGIEELIKYQEIADEATKVLGAATAIMSPEAFSVFIINGVVSYIQENSPYEVAKKDLKETMKTVVNQHITRLRHIAADPPQTNYQRPAVPVVAGAHFEDSSNPLTEALARYMAHQDAVSAVSGALLDAIERYQGADQTGDAQWALRHARTIEELTSLYAGLVDGLDVATTDLIGILNGLSGDEYTRFILHVRGVAEAFDRLSSEKYFDPAPDLSSQSEVLNTNADPVVVREIRERYAANDSDALPGVPDLKAEWIAVFGNARTALDDYATAFDDMDELAAANVPLLETELGDLDQDPQLTITVEGAATAGSPVTLSVGPTQPGQTFDWDLDADGDFDDSTGPSVVWTVPGDAMVNVPLLVSVRGGDATHLDSAIAVVTVASGGNVAPAIVSRTMNGVAPTALEVAPGATTTMSVTASDTVDSIADTLTYTWMVNGAVVPGATSPAFTYTTPADRLGTFYVDLDVSDGRSTTNTAFFIWSRGPDADLDGYMGGPLGTDCLDTPLTVPGITSAYVHPAGYEYINSFDDNCNGIVDDVVPGSVYGTPPTLWNGRDGGVTIVSSEGTGLRIRGDRWTHPNMFSGNDTYRLSVNWDDGTPTATRDVTYDTVLGVASINPDFFHTYDDQFDDLRIEFCWEWLDDPAPDPLLGNEKQCAATNYTVRNDRPIVNPADFRTWTGDQRGGPSPTALFGDWFDMDPVGKTLVSADNPNNFVVRTSSDLLGVNGYGRAAFNHEVLRGGDDDDILVLFGYDPTYDVDPLANDGPEGEFFDPQADIIGVSWANPDAGNYPTLDPSQWCSMAPVGSIAGSRIKPFTMWRQHGQPNVGERAFYRTFHYPGSAQSGCDDADGYEVLAEVPYNDATDRITRYGWLPRAVEPYSSGAIAITEPYLVEYDYQPRSITVWVNGVQQMRYDVPGGQPDLPPSRLSVAQQSQANINVSASAATPVFDFVQGRGGEFDKVDAAGDPVLPDGITMPMHDGAGDTHEARIDWGDGETTTNGVVTARPDEGGAPYTGNGWFTITGDHVYERAGTLTGNVCVTDDEGLSMCAPFVAEVANQAPRVDAGPDIAVGAVVALSDITFQDPGQFDTHTATIDWDGDGPSAPEPVPASDIAATRGGGTITAAHTFIADGPTEVRVCVTDNVIPAVPGCDVRSLDVRLTNVTPVASLLVEEGVEGDLVDVGIGITDANVDEDHTITVNWGDASAPEQPAVAQSLVGCSTSDSVDFDDFDPNDIVMNCGLTASASPTHVYADNGAYQVTVEVCDSDGGCDTTIEVITITNAAPTVTVADPVVDGQVVDMSGTYSDPSSADTHHLTVDWGDSANSNQGLAGGTFQTSHTYSAATSTASITLCVVDDDNGSTCVVESVTLGPVTPKIPFLVSLTPARLLDTRDAPTIDGNFRNLGPLGGGTTIELQVTGRGGVPVSGVDSAVLNVGALVPSADGYLTIYPCGGLPTASSLNYTTGVNIPNEIIAKLSPTGTVCMYTWATTGLIADVVGYVPAGSDYRSLTPARLLDTRDAPTIDGNFRNLGPLGGGTTIELQVTGRGGVPVSGVDSAVLNVGALVPSADGYLTIYPCGGLPTASSLNYTTGVNIPNEIIAKLSPTGTVCMYTWATTGLIADVVGYIPVS